MKKLLLSLLVLLFSGSLYAAVDLNTASVEELQAVKGVGASKAEAIVQHRKQYGPFKRVEDLDNVKGFGKKTVERLQGEFTVSKPDKK
ncbi:MAG: helix-hairpin-helix domain-containing protein [Pseudomonadota bacterium]